MPAAHLHIELPPEFDVAHEQAVGDYLADRLTGRDAWALAFAAFDLLDRAVLVTAAGRTTFRAVYRDLVDRPLADAYIDELLALGDVHAASPALWARYARRIVQAVTQRGWRRPETRLLVAYLLYWWGAFARGYALEVEVFRDLEQTGIAFTAHDLRNRQQRFSPSDLTVRGMAGDIKTSMYFAQVATPLVHDFYIVRLIVREQEYTLVTMLQPEAWDQINGDTMSGELSTLTQGFPAPVAITHRGHRLVVLDYNAWKQRVLRVQGGTP
jgi:hypothetical protein